MKTKTKTEKKTKLKSEENEIRLGIKDIPKKYFNIGGVHELPRPKHPGTGEELGPEAFEPLFTRAACQLEFSRERRIEIPREIREGLAFLNRPTPLRRALGLEHALGTSCRIYFKREDTGLAGSHKANTAIAQAFYAKEEGLQGLATETGAGQWGTALSLACARYGIGCDVFMVRCSYDQKPGRKTVIGMYGGRVTPSPSGRTEFGRKLLAARPDHPGSLGIAISEALEIVVKSGGKLKYALGSVLNHVLIHQSVIGLEAQKQLKIAGESPDYVVGCVGGGSNFAGLAYPLLASRPDAKFIAVEPVECPSVTRGKYAYDFGDSAKTTPLLKMYTLGADFIPPQIYAGGLRYHGLAPSLSYLIDRGLVSADAIGEKEVFAAARVFARAEGIVPAPESAHAVAEVVRLARQKQGKTIVFNLSGHGLLDLAAYATGNIKKGREEGI